MKLRKTLDPQAITAVVDSREQTPLDLAPLRVITKGLKTGDYSVDGLEHVIAIERKSLQDLIMCVGRERDRFEAEVKRLMAYDVHVLMIEGSWASIEAKQYRGDVHPNAVIGSICGWIASGLTVVFAGDRTRAGALTAKILYTTARRRWNEMQPFIAAHLETVAS